MVEASLRYLALAPGRVVVDATVGCAGHARRLLPAALPGGLLIGMDRDPRMLRIAAAALASFPPESWRLFEANYADLDRVLRESGVAAADAILLDAGFASAQMDDPERGLSYRFEGPLDMRYSPDATPASELVNGLPAEELARIFREYGEERFARRIAARIVRERERAPIATTRQLAALIARAAPPGRRRLHPARRCFQALRIAANSELEHLQRFLPLAIGLLRPGGRMVAICYHSLEDRLVKRAFLAAQQGGLLRIETRHVVRPEAQETAANPRARSARLRAATRLAPQPEAAPPDHPAGANP